MGSGWGCVRTRGQTHRRTDADESVLSPCKLRLTCDNANDVPTVATTPSSIYWWACASRTWPRTTSATWPCIAARTARCCPSAGPRQPRGPCARSTTPRRTSGRRRSCGCGSGTRSSATTSCRTWWPGGVGRVRRASRGADASARVAGRPNYSGRREPRLPAARDGLLSRHLRCAGRGNARGPRPQDTPRGPHTRGPIPRNARCEGVAAIASLEELF